MKPTNRRRGAAPPKSSRRLAVPWTAVRAATRQWTQAAAMSLAFAVVLALGLPRAATWLVEHPYFAIEGVEFSQERPGGRSRLERGQPRISQEELDAWAAVAPGTPYFWVEPKQLARRMEAHPWIRRATVTLHPPRRVVVHVREHKPLAIVRLDELYYVDRRGALMGTLAPNDSRDLPIISGLHRGHGRTSLAVALPRVAHLLRRQRVSAWLGPISEVHFDAEHGVTIFPMEVQVSLYLGADSWQRRLKRARRVLVAWRGQEARMASIDVTGTDDVIVRMRAARPTEQQHGQAATRKTRI